MFASKPFLSFLLAALSIVHAAPANPTTATFPLTFMIGNGANLVASDKARALAFKNAGNSNTKRATPESDLRLEGISFFYIGDFYIGSPATTYELMIDTGSAITWVGANTTYKSTSFSQDTGNSIWVHYGNAFFSGEEWVDMISYDQVSTIKQSIGVAKDLQGFSGVSVDGIIGLGPSNLTAQTTSNGQELPTVMDNLKQQGYIMNEVFGLYYVPANADEKTEITYGHYDTSKITSSEVHFVPRATQGSTALFWGITQSILYNSQEILSSTTGIIDSTSALILIASDAFEQYKSATGATVDPTTNLLTITNTQYNALQPLTMMISGVAYELCANAQIWPRSLNEAVGGTADAIYLVIGDIGTYAGNGDQVDFVVGFSFIQRFMVVFDSDNNQVGFATTSHSNDDTN